MLAVGVEFEGLESLVAFEDEVAVGAIEILDQGHQLAAGGEQRVVEAGLLARVAGFSGFEAFHEAIEIHLRAAERGGTLRPDD